jgi:lipopolysaccharide biosynthesis regulator YciM
MDFALQWLLIGLPVAFALGWVASRFDLRQLKRQRRDAPRAYFEGLNLLLNEQQDKAIDAFIEAVQSDPDTTELHFALGNLFRRRGEFERAVRVHEHLVKRGDLPASERHRAQHALAQDYMKAGLFDRAEAAYIALVGTSFESDAQLALLSLHERSRDWRQAITVARKLDQAGGGSFAPRMAHYECELALEADAQGRPDDGDAALARARAIAPAAPRPLLLQGQRALKAGDTALALQLWGELRERHPASFLLVAGAYADAALAAGEQAPAQAALSALLERLPAVELLQALQNLQATTAAAAEGTSPTRDTHPERLARHLRQHPSLSAAQLWLALPEDQADAATLAEGNAALREAVAKAARPLQRYRCAACGFEAQHYFWQCPGCLSWDSYPPQRIDAH